MLKQGKKTPEKLLMTEYFYTNDVLHQKLTHQLFNKRSLTCRPSFFFIYFFAHGRVGGPAGQRSEQTLSLSLFAEFFLSAA